MRTFRTMLFHSPLVIVLMIASASMSLAQKSATLYQPKLTTQNSSTTEGLIAVSPVNSRVVWAVGRHGTFVVTTDGGKTWKNAVIQEPVHSKAHTRFVYPWIWNGEEAIIAARCTDERGSTQPTTAEAARMRGIDVETLKTKVIQRNNVTQPWKVDRDGRVTNAIFTI